MQKCSQSNVQSVGFIRQLVKSAEQKLAKCFAGISRESSVPGGHNAALQVKEREMENDPVATWVSELGVKQSPLLRLTFDGSLCGFMYIFLTLTLGWSWSFNSWATLCEEPTRRKRPWC